MSFERAARTLGAVLMVSGLLRPAHAAEPESGAAPLAPSVPPVSESDAARASREFSRAVKLFKQGDVEQALPVFSALAHATHSPNAWLYVGHCQVRLARYVEAHAAFQRTLRETAQRSDDKYESTREAAAAQLSWLAVRVSKLVLALSDQPSGLVVEVDDRGIDAATLGSELVLAPGAHRVEATGHGVEPIIREIEIQPGETKTITLVFEKRAAPRAAAVAPPPSRETRESGARQLRVLGFAAAGVGAAGLAVFAVAGLGAKSTYDGLREDCAEGGCTSAAERERIDSGKSKQTIANLGLTVGAAGAVASGVLLYLGYSTAEQPVSVSVSTEHARVGYTARF